MKLHIHLLLLTLFTIFILQACSSMLAIGTAAFITTKTWNDPRTIGTQLDDKILETYISHELKKNQHIKKTTRIINIVYQGNILLLGQSPSLFLSEQANQIVKNIHGTKKIYNAIRKKKPISLQSIIFDTWISSQIRLHLLICPNIHSSNIKIITEDKEVFLLGQITHEEILYIKNLTNTIYGIKNIFTYFIYV